MPDDNKRHLKTKHTANGKTDLECVEHVSTSWW